MSRFSHPWSRFFFGNHGFLGYLCSDKIRYTMIYPPVNLHDIHQKCGLFPKKPWIFPHFNPFDGYNRLQSATKSSWMSQKKSTPSDKRGCGAMAPDSEGEVVMAPSNTSCWEDSAGVNSKFAEFWGGGMAEKVLLKISRGLRMGYKFFLNIASTCVVHSTVRRFETSSGSCGTSSQHLFFNTSFSCAPMVT